MSKAGDGYLRRLLVQCAHYILVPFGKDSDLRRFGLRLAARGGRGAKKRAGVAVARKLDLPSVAARCLEAHFLGIAGISAHYQPCQR